MKKTLTILLLILSTLQLIAQNQTDTIEVKQSFGTIFRQNGRNLTPKDLLEITKLNAAAYQEMQVAKKNYDAASIFGFAGGFMIGWPLGAAIAGGKPNWTLAAIGAGLVVVSIPLTVAYTKHAKNAVSIYNGKGLPTASRKIDFNLGLTGNGLGVTVTF